MIQNLPTTYNKETKNIAFGEVVASMETFKSTKRAGLSLADQIRIISNVKVDDGFGTALKIVSTDELDPALSARFEELFQTDINFERYTDAAIRGVKVHKLKKNKDGEMIKIRDDDGNLVFSDAFEARCEIPNWDKTVGTTLPGWADPASRIELIDIIYQQINKNIKAIIKFKQSSSSSADDAADAAHRLFMTKFLIGVANGLFYARKGDFTDMQCSREQDKKIRNKKGEVVRVEKEVITENPMLRIGNVSEALVKNDIEAQIAARIEEIRARN